MSADITPPTLTGLTFPRTIDLSAGATAVTFGAQAQDNSGGSGIDYVGIRIDKQFATNYSPTDWIYIGGGENDSWIDSTPTSSTTIKTLTTATAPGVYAVTSVRVSDKSGNTTDYSYSQLLNLGINTSFTVIDGAPDTTAPTVSTFSPSDGATVVAVASNIVLAFSEAIQRGTGSIVLKNAAGTTIETFDAATSNLLSISGSTLTINPTRDLVNSTNYYVTFASGNIKDLTGNAYAGTTTYNFTTASYPNHAPTGSVSITGTPTQNQPLTASNTLADADGLGTVSYQWKANGANISGAVRLAW